MTKTEMLTLLANGVAPETIATADAASAMVAAIRRSRRKVDEAQDFDARATWSKLTEIFEGVLEADREFKAERRPKKKSPYDLGDDAY